MAVITVPRPLREKLGEEGTDALVALINEAGENNKQSVIEVVEERFERRLAEEMSKVREEMSKLRIELSGETSKLRVELFGETSKLRTEMRDLRANLVQWMFLFWIGQIGVLTGILFAFFRK
jgi:bifunctional DNA-binding transcriptional regulator/antitoxin component of YhaV-PrlF toxin-antitoxin module